MASREASLKVTLQPASFQAGLRRMEGMVSSAGKRMGTSLKGPMVAGLKSAKKEVASMVSGLKSGLKMAASLGGALSFVGLAKDAVNMQNTYRNIAFNVNKVAGNAETWVTVQKMITGAVDQTGRSAGDLSQAFMEVFEATGSMEYAEKAMMNVGETATATGHSIGALANVMQLANRKFGVGLEDADEAMARFIEKTGVGGKGIEEMTSRFALMAGEAAGAGMAGTEGISQMLGMLLLLDSSIGEKADPGLKMMFQTIKSGSVGFVRLKKDMRGVKFDADMSAMDKILATLTSKRGRKAAEQVFTADARVVYDELAKPFDDAMKKTVGIGLSKKERLADAMAAFRKNLSDAAQSTMKYSKIQEEAVARGKSDPLIKLNKAMARMGEAFTRPKMINAMNNLADKLPALADTMASVIDMILDNPWESLALVVGAKIGLAFGGAAISKAVGAGITSMFASASVTSAFAAAGVTVGTTVSAAIITGLAAFFGTKKLMGDEGTGVLQSAGAAVYENMSGEPGRRRASQRGVDSGSVSVGEGYKARTSLHGTTGVRALSRGVDADVDHGGKKLSGAFDALRNAVNKAAVALHGSGYKGTNSRGMGPGPLPSAASQGPSAAAERASRGPMIPPNPSPGADPRGG